MATKGRAEVDAARLLPLTLKEETQTMRSSVRMAPKPASETR